MGAYRRLDAWDVPINRHAEIVSKAKRWASFFDAFVCGLFLGLDITMISAGQEPVNLRHEVKSMLEKSNVKWPDKFDGVLQQRFIGYVNASDVTKKSGQNHFVKLDRV